MTRGAFTPHPGQSDGNSYSAIDRSLVNGPQLSHIYSYIGMTGVLCMWSRIKGAAAGDAAAACQIVITRPAMSVYLLRP
jgi:hypothetical protein